MILRITDDSTRADLAEAIRALRAKQQRVTLAAAKAEIQVEIDGLLDRYEAARA